MKLSASATCSREYAHVADGHGGVARAAVGELHVEVVVRRVARLLERAGDLIGHEDAIDRAYPGRGRPTTPPPYTTPRPGRCGTPEHKQEGGRQGLLLGDLRIGASPRRGGVPPPPTRGFERDEATSGRAALAAVVEVGPRSPCPCGIVTPWKRHGSVRASGLHRRVHTPSPPRRSSHHACTGRSPCSSLAVSRCSSPRIPRETVPSRTRFGSSSARNWSGPKRRLGVVAPWSKTRRGRVRSARRAPGSSSGWGRRSRPGQRERRLRGRTLAE